MNFSTAQKQGEHQCGDVGQLSPCTIVIFGGSGDLTARKLIPSLYRMYRHGFLPSPVTIIGCARTTFSRAGYIDYLRPSCCEGKEYREELWQEFSSFIHYVPLQYDDVDSYHQLAEVIAELDAQRVTGGNILFDLAVPPSLYGPIATALGTSGLAQPTTDSSWVRLVVEKPFGRDLASALELEETLHRYFTEEQIFRIDHYLAKETVQNLLSFRFANQIFEPIWNRSHIDWVGIISSETLGVEGRAGYYDRSGVLRDMFQNHMMQLLSLIAMEPPTRFQADEISDEKVKVFRSIPPFASEPEDIILGQYQEGELDGEQRLGYRQEDGVDPQSRTATFALLKLGIDNWRWKGVPFYLISGKRMKRKETRIVIQFKEAPHSMFRHVLDEHVTGNRLVLSIYPEESIELYFQVKKPGPRICLDSMAMDFSYEDHGERISLDAYEKVLLDCILGDHMLFWRHDGVARTWALMTPILEDCEGDHCKIQALHPYAAGSWGPEVAREIVERIVK